MLPILQERRFLVTVSGAYNIAKRFRSAGLLLDRLMRFAVSATEVAWCTVLFDGATLSVQEAEQFRQLKRELRATGRQSIEYILTK
jgi:hypothetical protein